VSAALQLYQVMLGGRAPRATVELHDVVFAVGTDLASLYGQLRAAWFGQPAGLHIDCWQVIEGVDGWRVRLDEAAPDPSAPKLYFVNLGGYLPGQFGEEHRYEQVVAADAAAAKAAAMARVKAAGWDKPHRDALVEVDDCLHIGAIGRLHVHLDRGEHAVHPVQCDYIVLN
jgi:hypothetical protein